MVEACPFCGKTYRRFGMLLRHVEHVHKAGFCPFCQEFIPPGERHAVEDCDAAWEIYESGGFRWMEPLMRRGKP